MGMRDDDDRQGPSILEVFIILLLLVMLVGWQIFGWSQSCQDTVRNGVGRTSDDAAAALRE